MPGKESSADSSWSWRTSKSSQWLPQANEGSAAGPFPKGHEEVTKPSVPGNCDSHRCQLLCGGLAGGLSSVGVHLETPLNATDVRSQLKTWRLLLPTLLNCETKSNMLGSCQDACAGHSKGFFFSILWLQLPCMRLEIDGQLFPQIFLSGCQRLYRTIYMQTVKGGINASSQEKVL